LSATPLPVEAGHRNLRPVRLGELRLSGAHLDAHLVEVQSDQRYSTDESDQEGHWGSRRCANHSESDRRCGHVGVIDTDLTKDFKVPKSSPAEVVRHTLGGLAADKDEVLAGEGTRVLKRGLSRELASYVDPAPLGG
jgi:hypothetical protein